MLLALDYNMYVYIIDTRAQIKQLFFLVDVVFIVQSKMTILKGYV